MALIETRRVPNKLVTIGLPVYNGENYIAEAMESVLAQTYPDFEFIISDNASTDGTAEICRKYASSDKRIRYHCNPVNLGAAPNYNQIVKMGSADYFKWIAHDDILTPNFLEKCVAALEANPHAVACSTGVRIIDAKGNEVGLVDGELPGGNSPRVSDRFAAVLFHDLYCQSIFGLFRTRVLNDTPLLGSFHNSDRVLMAELAVRGPFVHVTEPLFLNRVHNNRYTSGAVSPRDWAAWHNTKNAGRLTFPLWKSYAEYVRMVRDEVKNPRERSRCFGQLVRWWFVRFNSLRMILDVFAAFEPRAFILARAVKHRLSGGTTLDVLTKRGGGAGTR